MQRINSILCNGTFYVESLDISFILVIFEDNLVIIYF